ncbi:hypothetical protein EW145_g6613 [Phellinidium pouzarii]|uniref:FAD-binding PCMH-type domain-containing protein n=1 Tax=Phellinidium pouzarii TaxID=167371 RepID=A0A4S4KW20_9AGAM|nr:hypothetical protein EW145_g6613 [Phellinidium pouzarii]
MALSRLAVRQLQSSPSARRWTSSHAKAFAGLNSVAEADLSHFSRILPDSCILSMLPPTSLGSDDLSTYNTDWMGKYKGRANTVLKPKTTAEVSAIVKWCWEKRIGVVPQGGNTGLVGGSVPLGNELIINLGNMSKVRSFDPTTGILVADAGCVLEALSEYIAPHNYVMPLDLGAKGRQVDCMIGGNVATNAGGLRLLRYGSLHGTVLGLEVVLPDGTILNQLSQLRKDNTGYDLKQLFIGAEGTLGIITGVSILTAATPQASNNVFLALPTFNNVLPLYMTARQQLSEILSAFEFIDRSAYELAVKHGQGKALSDEDTKGAECFVLLETSGGKREHDEEKLNKLLESLLEAEEPLVNTGVLSQSPAQFASLWALREGITEAVSKEGKAYKYDISVPLSSFKDVVDLTREHLRKCGLVRKGAVTHVIGYGHVGDGNLHLNIVADQYSTEIQDALEPFVYELVASYQGSISAEHGIGAMKTHALHYSKDDKSIEWMKRIKNLFDERGIMNPGKIYLVDGQPVKFFIQKDLPKELRGPIEETIKVEGGSIETKVPIRGYVIIQPGTPEAERLSILWQVEERPYRYFLPYTWVNACKERGRLLSQVFVEKACPVKFHIHKSIANMKTREELCETITLHGGNPHSAEENATVILASSQVEAFREMRKELQGSDVKFVENLKWLQTCIDQNLYYHSPNAVKNAGGRRPGDETAFSDEDEANLCNWIATVIPYKESGGRTGNKIYQELVSRATTPGYEWVERHTWQSWRERYKKNAARLDQHIAAIVHINQINGIAVPEKAQFGYFKLTDGKSVSRRKRRKYGGEQQPEQELQFAETFTADNDGSAGPSFGQESQESEWTIREGSDPVPNWAKRPASEDVTLEGSQKRTKIGPATFRTFVLTPADQNPGGTSYSTGTEFTRDFAVQNLDFFEPEILRISRDLQFVSTEVRAYYERTHDIVATRQRFERVRALMNTMP